jgi:1,4-dihydroxy-2-naphthoate polyprenyltransferase
MTTTLMSPARPSAPGVWWLAIRPNTLSLSVVPVLVGSSLAWHEQGWLAWPAAIAAALAAMLIQIGTNLHNDAADFERGADGANRLGPPRATAAGWLNPAQVRAAAYGAFIFAFLLGIYLVWVGGVFILALGLLSIASGLAYTGGPKPIAYSGLGELFVFLFFGIAAVMGSYYLSTKQVSWSALAAAAALGLLAAAVLTVNNYRDLDSDRLAGKITLAVRIGRRATRVEYALLLLAPFALVSPIALDHPPALLPWLALPLALWLVARFYLIPSGSALNALLARTAQLQLAFGLLLSVGLIV